MDNSRIRTGYDVEILLGEAYFRSIFQAAYDANQIPHSFTILSTVKGEPDSIVHVSEPLEVDLQVDDERNLTVTVEIKRQRRTPDGEIVLDRLPVTIEPEGAKAYVRGKPDASEDNNLEALPQF